MKRFPCIFIYLRPGSIQCNYTVTMISPTSQSEVNEVADALLSLNKTIVNIGNFPVSELKTVDNLDNILVKLNLCKHILTFGFLFFPFF